MTNSSINNPEYKSEKILFDFVIKHYVKREYIVSTKYSIQLKELCLKKKSKMSKEYFAKSLLLTGKNLLNLELVKKAEENILHSLEILDDYENYEIKYDCYNVLGKIYSIKKKISLALDYYMKALEYFKADRNWIKVAKVFNNISELYYRTGNHEKSYDVVYSSLKYLEIKNHIPSLIIACLSLGRNLVFQKRYLKALKYYDFGYSLIDQKNNYQICLNYQVEFGRLFVRMKKYEKAIEMFLKAEMTMKQLSFSPCKVDVYQEIAKVYALLKNWEKACEYSHKSQNYKEKNNLLSYDSKLEILTIENNLELKKKEYYDNKTKNIKLQEALNELKQVQLKTIDKEKENTLLKVVLKTKNEIFPYINNIELLVEELEKSIKNSKNEKNFKVINKNLDRLVNIVISFDNLIKNHELTDYSESTKMFKLLVKPQEED